MGTIDTKLVGRSEGLFKIMEISSDEKSAIDSPDCEPIDPRELSFFGGVSVVVQRKEDYLPINLTEGDKVAYAQKALQIGQKNGADIVLLDVSPEKVSSERLARSTISGTASLYLKK